MALSPAHEAEAPFSEFLLPVNERRPNGCNQARGQQRLTQRGGPSREEADRSESAGVESRGSWCGARPCHGSLSGPCRVRRCRRCRGGSVDRHAIEAHRADNVFDLPFAQIFKRDVKLPGSHRSRRARPALRGGRRDSGEARNGRRCGLTPLITNVRRTQEFSPDRGSQVRSRLPRWRERDSNPRSPV
jgi:hypothetical protein